MPKTQCGPSCESLQDAGRASRCRGSPPGVQKDGKSAMSRQSISAERRVGLGEFKQDLLGRLGLRTDASDQDVESAHNVLVDFPEPAPNEAKSWAAGSDDESGGSVRVAVRAGTEPGSAGPLAATTQEGWTQRPRHLQALHPIDPLAPAHRTGRGILGTGRAGSTRQTQTAGWLTAGATWLPHASHRRRTSRPHLRSSRPRASWSRRSSSARTQRRCATLPTAWG